jgi:hypothetical protein
MAQQFGVGSSRRVRHDVRTAAELTWVIRLAAKGGGLAGRVSRREPR